VLAKLQQHPWPGTIREMLGVVRRALLVRTGPQLEERDITFDDALEPAPVEPAGPALALPEGMRLEEMMRQVERQFVESALRRCHYHRERTAKELGLGRTAIFKRLKEWGIDQGEE
jgi:DNA-binding NtrC family response regulator